MVRRVLSPASRVRSEVRCGERRVVLVVEDDHKLAGLLVRVLSRAGFEPLVAKTGDAALQAMRHGEPCAAVVDIRIPHPDGIEVCRQFRRDRWRGPIVAISALNSTDNRTRAARAGADAFLAKPFPLADLVTVIEGLLGHSPGHQWIDPTH